MVGDKEIEFKLDSGSDVNIIPWEYFKEIKPGPQLKHNKYSVELYRWHKIECIGKCEIKCTINSQSIDNIEFLILKPSQQLQTRHIPNSFIRFSIMWKIWTN